MDLSLWGSLPGEASSLPFPFVMINIQEEEKISDLITAMVDTGMPPRSPLRTKELIPWLSPSSGTALSIGCNLTQGHIPSPESTRPGLLDSWRGSSTMPSQLKTPHGPLRLLSQPHHSPAPPCPVLLPSLLHHMVPNKVPQNSLQTLFSKESQL